MNRLVRLRNVVKYNNKRIQSNIITIDNYITTDNVLQNKAGITTATNLPPQGTTMPVFEKNNIMVANIRPYLKKIWFADRDGGCSADVLVFEVNKKYDSKYVYYSMYRDDFFDHVMRGSKGTKMPRGDKNQILDFLIPDFDINIQQQIASVLSTLDSKIALNNRINAELEAMAKTMYDYWFVQFDFPYDFAQGKPDPRGKPYKSSGGKMVWNEELKREIPEGWRKGDIGQIADLIRGVSYGSQNIKTENDSNVVPILRATNISGNVIDLENMVYVPNDFVSDKQILNQFDILMTMSSGSKEHIGKNAFYYYNKRASFGAFCAKLVAQKDFRFYLFSYTQSDFMFQTIRNECLGTNINNLNGGIVNGFNLLIPSIEVLRDFNNIVEQTYEKIGNNHKENQDLSSLRNWLLPMLMNGQVKLGEVVDMYAKRMEEKEGLMVAESEEGYGKSEI